MKRAILITGLEDCSIVITPGTLLKCVEIADGGHVFTEAWDLYDLQEQVTFALSAAKRAQEECRTLRSKLLDAVLAKQQTEMAMSEAIDKSKLRLDECRNFVAKRMRQMEGWAMLLDDLAGPNDSPPPRGVLTKGDVEREANAAIDAFNAENHCSLRVVIDWGYGCNITLRIF